MKVSHFLTASISYAKPATHGEKTLSMLSRYFFLGGKRVIVYENNEIELQKKQISWKTTTVKIIAYTSFAPITVFAYLTNLSLRVYYLRGMSLRKQIPTLPLHTNSQDSAQETLLSRRNSSFVDLVVSTEVEAKTKTEVAEAVVAVDQAIQIQQSQAVELWLEQHQKDFIAHAIWEGNIGKVIQSGAVLPAEAVLKENGEVEYEKGSTHGSRGTFKLIDLTEEDRKAFVELTSEDQPVFNELQSKQNQLTLEEQGELKKLDKLIFDKLEEADQEDYLECKSWLQDDVKVEKYSKSLHDLKQKGLANLSEEDQKRYQELSGKDTLSLSEKKRLKILQKKKLGMFCNYKGQGSSYLSQNVKELQKSHGCNQETLFLSYYLKYNNIYPWLGC